MTLELFQACDLRPTSEGGIGRESMPRYAGMLRALLDGPLIVEDIRDLFGMERDSANRLLGAMEHLGLISICGWRKRGNGPPAAEWTYPAGPRAPVPLNKFGKPSMSNGTGRRDKRMGIDIIAFASLVRCLQEGGATIDDLVEASGLSRVTVWRAAGHMRALGLVHISDWKKSPHGARAPMFTAAIDQRDAPRPRPMTGAERCRRHNAARRKRSHFARLAYAIAANTTPFQVAA